MGKKITEKPLTSTDIIKEELRKHIGYWNKIYVEDLVPKVAHLEQSIQELRNSILTEIKAKSRDLEQKVEILEKK